MKARVIFTNIQIEKTKKGFILRIRDNEGVLLEFDKVLYTGETFTLQGITGIVPVTMSKN